MWWRASWLVRDDVLRRYNSVSPLGTEIPGLDRKYLTVKSFGTSIS